MGGKKFWGRLAPWISFSFCSSTKKTFGYVFYKLLLTSLVCLFALNLGRSETLGCPHALLGRILAPPAAPGHFLLSRSALQLGAG